MVLTVNSQARYSNWGLKNLCILAQNVTGDLGSRRERYWGCISFFGYTPKQLILKSISPLEVASTLLSVSRKGMVEA